MLTTILTNPMNGLSTSPHGYNSAVLKKEKSTSESSSDESTRVRRKSLSKSSTSSSSESSTSSSSVPQGNTKGGLTAQNGATETSVSSSISSSISVPSPRPKTPSQKPDNLDDEKDDSIILDMKTPDKEQPVENGQKDKTGGRELKFDSAATDDLKWFKDKEAFADWKRRVDHLCKYGYRGGDRTLFGKGNVEPGWEYVDQHEKIAAFLDECHRRALDGSDPDLCMFLRLLYSKDTSIRCLAGEYIPSLYFNDPTRVGLRFMETMARHDVNVRAEMLKTKGFPGMDMCGDATAYYLLCQFLHENAKAFKSVNWVIGGNKFETFKLVNQTHHFAFRHHVKHGEVFERWGEGKKWQEVDKKQLFSINRRVRYTEKNIYSDVHVNFDCKKNIVSRKITNFFRKFKFFLTKDDYKVARDVPVRQGGCFKLDWDCARGAGRSAMTKLRKKIDFVARNHLKEWERRGKTDLTTIHEIFVPDSKKGDTGHYKQLVLHNDTAAILDTHPQDENPGVQNFAPYMEPIAATLSQRFEGKVSILDYYRCQPAGSTTRHKSDYCRHDVARLWDDGSGLPRIQVNTRRGHLVTPKLPEDKPKVDPGKGALSGRKGTTKVGKEVAGKRDNFSERMGLRPIEGSEVPWKRDNISDHMGLYLLECFRRRLKVKEARGSSAGSVIEHHMNEFASLNDKRLRRVTERLAIRHLQLGNAATHRTYPRWH